MLTKKQKIELVKDLAEKIKSAKAVVFTDFRGLKVKDMTMLKKELRLAGASFKVTKKTLMERSLKDAGIEMDIQGLEGQIALAFSPDEITGAKIIDNFSKKNDKIKILAGLLENKMIDAATIKSLAKLPAKEELLGKLVATINAPVSGFVNVLTGNLRGLTRALKAIAESKV